METKTITNCHYETNNFPSLKMNNTIAPSKHPPLFVIQVTKGQPYINPPWFGSIHTSTNHFGVHPISFPFHGFSLPFVIFKLFCPSPLITQAILASIILNLFSGKIDPGFTPSLFTLSQLFFWLISNFIFETLPSPHEKPNYKDPFLLVQSSNPFFLLCYKKRNPRNAKI